jgi:hypothetical protein
MKQKRFTLIDLSALAVTVFLFLGCFAGSQRTARTLAPGQVAAGLGATHIAAASGSDGSANLVDLGLQVGVVRGMECGVMETFDVTADNKGMYSTFWGGMRFQLNNLDNKPGISTIGLGLSKGSVYNADADSPVNITSIPLTWSTQFGAGTAGFVQYRHELISESFFPSSSSFRNPRNVFTLGMEQALVDPSPAKWVPQLGISVNFSNDLGGGDFKVSNIGFNVGIWLDSPFSRNVGSGVRE